MKKRSALFELVCKDLKIEFRTKSNLNVMLLFAIASALIFSFSMKDFFAEVLIITLIFSSLTSSSFSREFEQETIEGLKASPLTPQQIVFSKAIFNQLFLIFVASILYPICYALFNSEANFFLGLLSLLICSLPISASATIIAPLSLELRERSFSIAMIFPVILPILAPATSLLRSSFNGIFDPFSSLFLIAYTGILLSLLSTLADHMI